jgi:uncharacterized protein (UPF0335 family)
MTEVNQTKTVANASITAFIQRIEAIQEQHNRQLDALKAELRAMLPECHDQARYQKLRVICSDRNKMRAFRDGRIKL